MRFLRTLSLIGLVLVLVSGSVTMAVARHQPRAVGEVELCTGYGPATITLDAQGNPVGPRILCPDCTPALAALTEAAPPLSAAPGTLTPLRFAPRVITAQRAAPATPFHSRAPPVRV